MRLLPLVPLLASLLVASAARATTVAVAPIRDDQASEAEALRKQVERGLADNGITVVSFAALMQAASDQGVGAADLAKPAVLMPVAKAAGAEAVLTGAVLRDGHNESLDIRVFSLDGVELWSRPIPMKHGKLGPDIPRKIAHAVAAAVASGPPPAAAGTPDTTAAPTPDATTPEVAPTPKADDGSATPTPTPEVAPTPKTDEGQSSDQGQSDESPPPRHPIAAPPAPEENPPSRPVKKGKKKASTGDEAVDVEGPPVEAAPDTTPAPPYIDVAAGLTLAFRSYNVCPGVTSCSQQAPNPTGNKDIPIKYSTGAPYAGFDIALEGFPLPHLVQINDTLTFTAGLLGEYAQGLTITNNYQDPTTGAQKTFQAYERHAEVGPIARLYYSALNGTGYAGLVVAYELHQFLVGANPVITESARAGFGIGAAGELPLAGDYFRVMARFTYMPSMNPGVTETTEYGQTGVGSGWEFRGGFDGDFPWVGYSATVGYTSFSDTYTGPGLVTTNGAVTQESYTTIYILAHGHF